MPFLIPLLFLAGVGSVIFLGSRANAVRQGVTSGMVPTPGNTKLQYSTPSVESESLMSFALPPGPQTLAPAFGVSNANGNIAIPNNWADFENPVATYNIQGRDPYGQARGPFGAPQGDDKECPCDPCRSTPGLLRYAGWLQ